MDIDLPLAPKITAETLRKAQPLRIFCTVVSSTMPRAARFVTSFGGVRKANLLVVGIFTKEPYGSPRANNAAALSLVLASTK